MEGVSPKDVDIFKFSNSKSLDMFHSIAKGNVDSNTPTNFYFQYVFSFFLFSSELRRPLDYPS